MDTHGQNVQASVYVLTCIVCSMYFSKLNIPQHVRLILYCACVVRTMGGTSSRWPAMVEEDPDKETYYEMGDNGCVPVRIAGDRE